MKHSLLQVLSTDVFDPETIVRKLDNIIIEKNAEGIITTTYFGRRICESQRTDRYGVFQFGEFGKEMLEFIPKYFNPKTSSIKIGGGRQEIQLVGDTVNIDGEVFSKIMNIISSSDGTRRLTINVGLVRHINNTRFYVSTNDEFVSVSAKHFKKSMPTKVSKFQTALPDLVKNLEEQIANLEALEDKTISLRTFCREFVTTLDGNIKQTGNIIIKAFIKRLWDSPTDRVNTDNFSYEQKRLLLDPTLLLVNGTADIQLSAKKIFYLISELYKERDERNIQTQTVKAYKIIQKLLS